MADFIKTDGPSITPWKGLAILAAVVGVGLALFAAKYEMKEVTKAAPAGQWPGKRFSHVRITQPGSFSGVSVAGGTIRIESLAAGQWKSVEIDTGLDQMAGGVKTNRKAAAAAWRHGQSLGVWTAGSGGSSRLPVSRVADFDFLDDSSLVLLTSDGVLEWWDPAARKKLHSRKIANGAAAAAIARDSLAVIGSGQTLVRVYTLGPGFRATLIEESRAMPPPFEVGIAGPGNAIFARKGEIAIGGRVHGIPGTILDVTPGLRGEILITGAFEGVLALGKKAKPEAILPALPGSVTDVAEGELVVSGPDGARLFRIASEWTFTERGKHLTLLSLLALIKSICIALAKHMKNMLFTLFKIRAKNPGKGKARKKAKLPAVAPDLLDSFSRGEVALWAGSGLSAQAGLATRAAFVKAMLEAAYAEEWARPAEVAKLIPLVEAGRAEEAVDKLILMLGARKHVVFEQMRCTYQRPVKSSGAHAAIGRLPFAAAVSTNYDILLDCVSPEWANSIHLKSSERAFSRTSVFFQLKLYGDMAAPESILYSRSELQAATAALPRLKELLESLLVARRIVFVGCSICELHADLTALNAPKLNRGVKTARHVCLAASGGPDWERKANELRSLWGIEVQDCDEDAIAGELYRWLKNTAVELERLKRSQVERKASQMAPAAALDDQ